MAQLTRLVLFLFVLAVTLTHLAEGRGRWRRRHRAQSDRRSGKRGHHGVRGHSFRKPDWLEAFMAPRYHSFDLFGSARNPFLSFDVSWGARDFKPWWQGPNVCETESTNQSNVTETGAGFVRHFSTASTICDESETAYKCKETVITLDGKQEKTVTRECCHGFTRKKGDHGCPLRVEMKSLLEKADSLGLSEFLQAVNVLRLDTQLGEGNFTIFAPVNGAFGLDSDLMEPGKNVLIKDEPHVIMMSEPSAERALESLQNALLGHVVIGSHRTSSLEDEQVLETASPGGDTVRINYFVVPHKVTTANCVPMESTDHLASNGVIHTLKKAMRPVTKSALGHVRSSPDLSTLKTVLASANYVSKLDQEGPLTLFAPTNQAFDLVEPRLRERLLRGDPKCLEKVLMNHLLPHTICMSAISGEAQTRNLLQQQINLTRSEDDKLFVDGAQVVQQDIMTTNGVVHLIDAVLVPQEALGVLDLLKKEGFTELLDLLDQSGLTKTIDTAENISLFAPTNDAIQNMPPTLKAHLAADPDYLAQVLQYHVSPGVRECGGAADNQLLPSLAGPDIRLNTFLTYHRFSLFKPDPLNTAQCIPVSHKATEACNGQVTPIGDVLVPPAGNVIDILALDKRFSTLVALVKQAGIADDLQNTGPFTIFAPNNEAFEMLEPRILQELTEDGAHLKKVLKGHVFGNMLCCAGIPRATWYSQPRVRTLAGNLVTVHREHDNDLRLGQGRILSCDRTATNGNVLEIDEVLLPARPFARRTRWKGFEP